MGVWIMSIVGVICLGILLEIVLPEGQTAKYVKGAFSLLIVFVIAAPLPGLFKKDWKLSFDSSDFKIDEDYINSTYAAYADGISDRVQRLLKENGYEASVEVEMSEDSKIKLKSLTVDVFNFKSDVADAVTEDVKAIISDKLQCDKSIITVLCKRKE